MAQTISVSTAVLGVVVALAAILLAQFRTQSTSPITATRQDNWNLFYHLGGYGPYVPKIGGIQPNETLPAGCRVEQVHMLARHTERYPTLLSGIRMLDLYHRIDRAKIQLNGSLEFINTWSFFTGEPLTDFDHLTRTGPYAGSKTAFDLGVRLRSDYHELYKTEMASNSSTAFWASGSQRVIETAQYFATAFFGLDWAHTAVLHIISEAGERGANTLTPGETCLNYDDEDNGQGWNLGATRWNEFRMPYLDNIRPRFQQENPNFEFTREEIYTMQEMCGFQIMVQGTSPWCDVFTEDDWDNYEYARDVLHYYRSGAGNPYAATMGWLWLNATANLLATGPEAGRFFFSFVHDGDIIPMLAALDLFPQPAHIPTAHIAQNRTWKTSDIVPMGANIIFERLTCPGSEECWTSSPMYPNHVYCAPASNETSVRIKVNEAVVALPGCSSGIGQSCPLQDFLSRVKRRGEELEDFSTLCGLSEEAPKYIDFLQQ